MTRPKADFVAVRRPTPKRVGLLRLQVGGPAASTGSKPSQASRSGTVGADRKATSCSGAFDTRTKQPDRLPRTLVRSGNVSSVALA